MAGLVRDEQVDGHRRRCYCIATRVVNGVWMMKTDNANPNDSGDHPIAIDHLSPDDHSCQMMMEKAPLAIFVLDGEGNFIEANDATCHLSGYSKAELISMSTVDVVGAETHTTALDDLSKLRKTGRVTTEFRLKRKDGSVIWALLEAVALSEDRFMGLCSNITERKQIEESLRQSEERYRGIFNESVAAIYHFDSQKRFIDSNQAGLDLLGYSRGDLLQMKISDVDADPKVVLPKHKILLSGDNLVNYEHQLKRKDGEIISVLNNSKPLTDELGNVIGMQSTLLNVTDRKRAQEQLRNSEARLTEAQHIANIGHWELDLITDHLTLSDEVYRILGVDPQRGQFMKPVHLLSSGWSTSRLLMVLR